MDVPNYITSLYMEQKLRKLKELDISISVDFNTSFSVTVRVNRH